MNKYCLLFLLGVSANVAAADKPLPMIGSDIPVNVLMCKSASTLQEVVRTAYSSDSASYDAFLKGKKDDGSCEIGGGAKISEVTEVPFFQNDTTQIHLIKVLFGGEVFYTNFNR